MLLARESCTLPQQRKTNKWPVYKESMFSQWHSVAWKQVLHMKTTGSLFFVYLTAMKYKYHGIQIPWQILVPLNELVLDYGG